MALGRVEKESVYESSHSRIVQYIGRFCLLYWNFAPNASRLALSQQIPHKRTQPGEAITGIDVMLDDIEHEVVKSGEAPDGHGEQQQDLDLGMLPQQKARGRAARQDEQDPFGV